VAPDRPRPAIAALVHLIEADQARDIQFKANRYGDIDPKWFANHLGPDLVPISEYKDFSVREASQRVLSTL
jgi:hypothetical protein